MVLIRLVKLWHEEKKHVIIFNSIFETIPFVNQYLWWSWTIQLERELWWCKFFISSEMIEWKGKKETLALFSFLPGFYMIGRVRITKFCSGNWIIVTRAYILYSQNFCLLTPQQGYLRICIINWTCHNFSW